RWSSRSSTPTVQPSSVRAISVMPSGCLDVSVAICRSAALAASPADMAGRLCPSSSGSSASTSSSSSRGSGSSSSISSRSSRSDGCRLRVLALPFRRSAILNQASLVGWGRGLATGLSELCESRFFELSGLLVGDLTGRLRLLGALQLLPDRGGTGHLPFGLVLDDRGQLHEALHGQQRQPEQEREEVHFQPPLPTKSYGAIGPRTVSSTRPSQLSPRSSTARFRSSALSASTRNAT